MITNLRLAGVELESWEQQYLTENLGPGVYVPGPLTGAPDLRDPEALLLFIYSRITAETLKQFPSLRLICTLSTGYDHIDLAACKKKNITVCNVPSYGEQTVAEYTFALLLALTRKIIPSVNQTRVGDFRLDGLRGIDLTGKTIGVIGTGRIGQHVIRMAKGFAMNVVAYDPFPQPTLAADIGFTYLTLDELLERSDVVTLHCPATRENRHLMDEDRLSIMKPTAILLNTARGSLVDTQALVRVLDRGHLSAVGLDVLEEEYAVLDERQLLSGAFQKSVDMKTVLADHVLLAHPRVIVTPHNAFNTIEALRRILDTTIQNVNAFAAGRPKNSVA